MTMTGTRTKVKTIRSATGGELQVKHSTMMKSAKIPHFEGSFEMTITTHSNPCFVETKPSALHYM